MARLCTHPQLFLVPRTTLGAAVIEAVSEPVPVMLRDDVGVDDCVPDGDRVRVFVAVRDGVGVPVCEPVLLRVAVPLELGVPVCEPV